MNANDDLPPPAAPAAPRLLVSACLLGAAVRHDGGHQCVEHALLARWIAEDRVVPFCPELAGGLPVPRPAAEIDGPGGGAAVLAGRVRVVDRDGIDRSPAFVAGAQAALAAARAQGVRVALLKDGSPSCGSRRIHDGSFAGRRIAGEGVAAARLREAGLEVFGEDRIDEAAAALARTTTEDLA